MTPSPRDAGRCANCGYDFQDLDFSRSTNCPECGRPACVRVPGGMCRREELARALGWIGGVAWFVVFLLSIPFGVDESWWWGVYVPLTVVVLGSAVCGINFLDSPRTRHRRLALCLTLVPAIAWAGLLALMVRAALV